MSYYTVKGIVSRGMPVLLATSVIGVLAGHFLNMEIENLVSMPLILVLIPALIKIGGDTGSMLGARVSTSLHMGLGSHIHKNPVVRNSVIAALIVGISACTFVAFTVWFTGILLGISMPLMTLLALCLIAGTFELFVVFALSISSAFISQRIGVDPDDTVIPIVATFGDLVGVIGIIFTMGLLGLI